MHPTYNAEYNNQYESNFRYFSPKLASKAVKLDRQSLFNNDFRFRYCLQTKSLFKEVE
jgi:hypothetical protein